MVCVSPSKTIEARQVVMSQDKGDKLDGYNCNGRYWIGYDVREYDLAFYHWDDGDAGRQKVDQEQYHLVNYFSVLFHQD